MRTSMPTAALESNLSQVRLCSLSIMVIRIQSRFATEARAAADKNKLDLTVMRLDSNLN